MAGLIVLASACAGPTLPEAGDPSESPTTTAPSASPGVPSATPSPTTDSSAPPAEVGESFPVTVSCRALVDANTLYDLNPNLGEDPDHRPSVLGAQAVRDQGVSCGWRHETAATPLSVAVAAYDQVGQSVARDAAEGRGGQPTAADLGVPGVFRVVGTSGTLELLHDQYWIVIESPMFAAASEAQSVVAAVVRALP